MIFEECSSGSSSSDNDEVWEVVNDAAPVIQGSIQIPLGKAEKQKAVKMTNKTGIKKRDRVVRAYSHFTHLLFVSLSNRPRCLYSVASRASNLLSKDGEELAALLLSFLPATLPKFTSSIDSINKLVEIFHESFTIEDFCLDDVSRSPLAYFDDEKCPALNNQTAVIGFVGLLRVLGLRARFVASLHPISLSFAQAKGPTPRKRKKKASSSEKNPKKSKKPAKKKSKVESVLSTSDERIIRGKDKASESESDEEMISRASSIKKRTSSSVISSEEEEIIEKKRASSKRKGNKRASSSLVDSDDEEITSSKYFPNKSKGKKRASSSLVSSEEKEIIEKEKRAPSKSKGKKRVAVSSSESSEEEIIAREKKRPSSSSATTIKNEKNPTPARRSRVSDVISLLDDDKDVISLISEDEDARPKGSGADEFFPVIYWCEVFDGSEWYVLPS